MYYELFVIIKTESMIEHISKANCPTISPFYDEKKQTSHREKSIGIQKESYTIHVDT